MKYCSLVLLTVLLLSSGYVGAGLPRSFAAEPPAEAAKSEAVTTDSTKPAATKADAPKSKIAEQIAAMAAEHDDHEKAFHATLSKLAKQSEELGKEEYGKRISAANKKYREYNGPAAEKLAELIKANRSDPAVVQGIMLYEGPMSHSLGIVPEFKEILLGEQFANPDLGGLCYRLRYNNNTREAEEILTAASSRHPLADVRGIATYALGEYYVQTARDWGHAPKTEAQKNELLGKAAESFAAAVAKYADVTLPDGNGTIGKQAANSLSRVKNIPNLRVGKPAPEVVGEDLEGRPIKLSDYRGKVVALVYWGSWCGPCMAQVPHERELVARLKDKPFVLLGVNCGDPLEKAKQTAADKKMEWTNVWDGGTSDGPFQAAYNVEHWPTVYVIDAEGVIQNIDVRGKMLDAAVDKLVAEAVKQ